MRSLHFSLVSLCVLTTADVTFAQQLSTGPPCGTTPLVASESDPYDGFGEGLALDGDRAFVGAPSLDMAGVGDFVGAVFVFERTPDGWMERQKLVASDAYKYARFGFSIAAKGDLLLVGAPACYCKNSCCTGDGAVYAFERVQGVWVETQKLVDTTDTNGVDGYGYSLAMHGDEALVGAPFVNHDGVLGRVFHLEYVGGTWTTTTFLDPLGAFAWSFGARVSLAQDLAVGAGYDDHPGPLFPSDLVLFERIAGIWTPVLHLDEAAGTIPGSGLALTEQRLFVGDAWTNSAKGLVKTYNKASGWQHQKTLKGSGLEKDDWFGSSVAVTGNTVFIGAPGDDDAGPDAGAVYVYEDLQLVDKLLPPLPEDDGQFGRSTALDQEWGLVGAPGEVGGIFQSRAYSVGCLGDVLPDPACSATSYCSTAPNSVGPGAIIGHFGSLSIAKNDFTIRVGFCPPNQFGVFFYGPGQTQVQLGDGFLCIDSAGIGLFRLLPPIKTDMAGNAKRLVDFTQPPAGAGPGMVAAGSTWHFQFWYRDPAAGGAGFNFSDGLAVRFCP